MNKFLITGFFLLSIFDLYMTLNHTVSAETSTESNPIAASVMAGYGDLGAIVFKLLLVSLVIVCVNKVLQHRPKLGRAVLVFGFTLMLCVAVYHIYLLGYWTSEAQALVEFDQPNAIWYEINPEGF